MSRVLDCCRTPAQPLPAAVKAAVGEAGEAEEGTRNMRANEAVSSGVSGDKKSGGGGCGGAGGGEERGGGRRHSSGGEQGGEGGKKSRSTSRSGGGRGGRGREGRGSDSDMGGGVGMDKSSRDRNASAMRRSTPDTNHTYARIHMHACAQQQKKGG